MLRKIIIIPIILLIIFFFFLLSPTGFSKELERFVIPLDAKPEEITKQLKNQQFIRSERLFDIMAAILNPLGKIEPGAYQLSHRMTLIGIINTLIFRPYQKWVIIKPGLRMEQTADQIFEKMKWDQTKKADFLSSAREGYLFPDTYLLNVDDSGADTYQRLFNNFNEKFDASIMAALLENNIKNDTAIKIASLIERESGGDSDKSLIAGIILNRLNTGMKLQIDATIQYALGTESNWWPKIALSDYKTDSPYNTYLIERLPPSPICSPSLASIKAIANPAETECLFYLHDHNKQIHCAQTYQEHLRNIERYLK